MLIFVFSVNVNTESYSRLILLTILHILNLPRKAPTLIDLNIELPVIQIAFIDHSKPF